MSTQTEETASSASAPSSNPLELYGNYPFATDETYQQGLASLVAGGALDGDPLPEVKEEILRRTRVFYFNRVTGNSVSMDEAREYEYALKGAASHGSGDMDAQPAASQSNIDDDDTRVLTFAELQELIETGKVDQIPHNKVIPEVLNAASPSESTVPARKKPWELTQASSGTDNA
ncbi:hypothetical protein Hypma_001778 [Hypsizygus marmoreus]|uniref:Uncharacterized protein n=1 Tax=Hypsizygus marmoreus TaxID=39966 RepID=A0A369J4V2_HYPMA|nr:hypothetical protein Hypma_001778 [Hypsizygus marmoreus]